MGYGAINNPENLERSSTIQEYKITPTALVEQLAHKRTLRYTVFLALTMFGTMSMPVNTYLPVLTGQDPVLGDKWSCLTAKCEKLLDGRHYNKTELFDLPCSTAPDKSGKEVMILGPQDVKWNLTRTSFSVEFGLYCDVGLRQMKKTLVSSMFFIGAVFGLISGMFLFDNVGRRKSVILGNCLIFLATSSGAFCHSYLMLMIIRFIQGTGAYITATGLYILMVELVPSKLRNIMTGFKGFCFAMGYPVLSAIGYFNTSWNYTFLTAGIIWGFCNIIVWIIPESVQFYAVRKDLEGVKSSLRSLAKIHGGDIDLPLEELILEEEEEENQQQGSSFKERIKDFIRYPALLKETLLLFFMWCITAMSYYGFNFGWNQLVPNIYLAYILAMVGEQIACLGAVPVIDFLGRRKAMIFMFLGAAVAYLISIPNVPLGGNWELSSVTSLIGIICISGVYNGIYLWAGEIAPTSHRGLIMGSASSIGRIGAFIGPFIFNNLAKHVHRAVPPGILAALVVLCALASYFQVETGDKEIAATAKDVQERRNGFSYKVLENTSE